SCRPEQMSGSLRARRSAEYHLALLSSASTTSTNRIISTPSRRQRAKTGRNGKRVCRPATRLHTNTFLHPASAGRFHLENKNGPYSRCFPQCLARFHDRGQPVEQSLDAEEGRYPPNRSSYRGSDRGEHQRGGHG